MAINGTSKMKKEISEYIVAHVLDHSDILIRGSQKRQNYDNEMRQELWSNLANKLAEVFDTTMEPEKVKQHFHNRRKAVMGRVREDLKRHGMENSSVDEKMEWIKGRRVVVNENDLQIIEFFFNKEQERDSTPAPTTMVTTTEFENSAMNFLNGLVHSEGTKCEGELEEAIDDVPSSSGVLESPDITLNMFQTPQLFLSPSSKIVNEQLSQPSQLIVEVPNKLELKRLLSLLIDNDFTRFTHVDESSPKYFGMKGQKKQCPKKKLNGENTPRKSKDIADTNGISVSSDPNEQFPFLSESGDLSTTAANLLFEMTKIQTEECGEEEVEEEEDAATNALVDLVKSFGAPEPKKRKEDGISLKCELCKNSVRLNQSGSKWNLYEHVVLNHSTHRPYKCTKCNYSGVRKGRVRQHILSAHDCDEEPENIATPDIREVWEGKMHQCFPTHKQIKSLY